MLTGSVPASRVAFRVDASATVGTGHLKRCLSLAQALAEVGAQTLFVCRLLDTVATKVFAKTGVAVRWLSAAPDGFAAGSGAPPHAAWAGVPQAQDADETAQALSAWRPDWVVVDHYAFDAGWHRSVRDALGCRLLVIDDTADRPLDPDVLLDPNWAADHRAKYTDRLEHDPRWLCGPRFALLASAYRDAPRHSTHDTVGSIGIFMGGTDPGGVSARMLFACRAAGFVGPVEVVSTSANPQLDTLRESCRNDGNASLLLDAAELATFFARHDLQIGAGGGATWERCCIGVPTIVLALASNQSAVVPALATLGAVRAADETTVVQVLQELIADPTARQMLANHSRDLVDGRGAQRVALSLLRGDLCLRSATLADARLLHSWRNHPTVRAVSGTQDPIAFDAHERWMISTLASPDRWLFVAKVGDLNVGAIRFDRLEGGHFEVSLNLDADLQGIGLGRRMLLAGEQEMLRRQPQGLVVDARVLPDNAASQRLFVAAGYHGGPLQYRKSVIPRSNQIVH